MDTKENVFWDYQRALVEVYKRHDLNCLSGLDRKYELNGRNLPIWYTDILNKSVEINTVGFNRFQHLDEILFQSDNILFATGNLYLYRPFLDNPLNNSVQPEGFDKPVYTYRPSLPDQKYAMFLEIAGEKTYNFWDRIAKFIGFFFPKNPGEDIYFSRVLQKIPENNRNNPNYQWLENFRNNEYKKLNDIRINSVHRYSVSTVMEGSYLENVSDKILIEGWIEERDSWAEFYKEQIRLTFEGFERTLLLLGEITTAT